MNAQVFAETLRPVEALDALMARHGVVRVLLALTVAAWKRRAVREIRPGELSAHLRRDIGLDAPARRGKSRERG